ncbi:recombination protein RecR [Candidatus Gottesmanbacteria bacterium]|nr:recombination protein RecR [Candidatus Gottesmanbacteria bacterium]
MARLPAPVNRLITSLQKLPGIGPKTAARLTFYLLNVPQEYLSEFGENISGLKKNTIRCSVCFNIDEQNPCLICSDSRRLANSLCVVEQPLDVLALERTGKYQGLYHVLHGAISPLDNIGPEELTIEDLLKRLAQGTIKEVILATNPSIEGEATAMYIANEIGKQNFKNLKVSRLARGLPVGGDIEYADDMTLAKALEGRREYQ